MSNSPWSTEEVQDYVLDCYAGVEMTTTGPRPVPYYAFMWEEDEEVWIGNSVAFGRHVARAFGFEERDENFWNVQSILRRAGERIHPKQSRTPTGDRPGTSVPRPRRRRIDRTEEQED